MASDMKQGLLLMLKALEASQRQVEHFLELRFRRHNLHQAVKVTYLLLAKGAL